MPLKYKIYFFLLISHGVFSQNFSGITGSNYVGTNSIPSNPANVVDTRHSVFINISAIGIDFQNNFVRWNAPFSLLSFVTRTTPSKYRNADGSKVIWRPDYLKTSERGKDLSVFANGEARGPAIGIDIKKWGLGIAGGVRYRFMNSMTKTSDEIGNVIAKTTRSAELIDNTYINNYGNLNSSFVNEVWGTVGKVIVEDDSKFIKIGGTAKYFVSNNFNNIKADNFDFTITRSPTDIARQDIDVKNAVAAFTDASQFSSLDASNFTDHMTQFTGNDTGFGGDLGIIYEYRPDAQFYTRNNNGKRFVDPTHNKYQYKIGLSLIDIGFMKYSANVATNALFNINGTIIHQTYPKFRGFENVIATTNSIFGTSNANSNSFIVLMPATSVFTFDYHLKENYYININWRQYLLGGKRRGMIGYSGLAIVPRMEKKGLELAIPLSLENNYKNLNLGFSARYYGLFLGSDNLTGWFNLFNPRGLSLYGGAFIPLYHRLPNSPLKCFNVANPQSYRKKKFRKRY